MDLLDEDLINFWRALNTNGVRYIMVGGFAAIMHGGSRITEDIDIWIEDSPANRKALRQALASLNLGDFAMLETMEFVPGWTTIYLTVGIELDILTGLKAFPQQTFQASLKQAYIGDIEGVKVPFLHFNQLIEEKKANGRPKDLLDVEELEKIKDLKKGDNTRK